MAKKPPEHKPKKIKHARLELPEQDYAVVEEAARKIGLNVTAYIRMVVLKSAREELSEP